MIKPGPPFVSPEASGPGRGRLARSAIRRLQGVSWSPSRIRSPCNPTLSTLGHRAILCDQQYIVSVPAPRTRVEDALLEAGKGRKQLSSTLGTGESDAVADGLHLLRFVASRGIEIVRQQDDCAFGFVPARG